MSPYSIPLWTRTHRAAVQIALRGAVRGRARRRCGARGTRAALQARVGAGCERCKDRVERAHDLRLTADHEAEPALEA